MPTSDRTERIAIVGVGGIFPGAPDLDHFWRNISQGVDSGQPVPLGRWFLGSQTSCDPNGIKPDRVYSDWGCFVENFQFDPTGLNLDPGFLARLDPLFHLGLHAARAAFLDAGQLSQTNLNRVGVILGNIVLPTESTSAMCRDVLGRTLIDRLIDATPLAFERRDELKARLFRYGTPCDWHPQNRFAASLPAALIAQGLNLGGVAYTLDAACASSLYALKFACEELRAYRADAMLAGGMSRPDCQYTQMGFAQLKALSRRGRCAPLSAAADGLVVGEGAGVFVLKRLSDAIASGDHVYGVIAGIGLSNDRGANLLAPHSEGQLRAMKSAYLEAGWQPSDVDLIECHATGTPVGDTVEISSLHQLWKDEKSRPGQCVIGGVKSNVGHLLTGAGAAGLMKVLLALKHQTLPPTANYESPAAALSSNNSPFRVLANAEPWYRRQSNSPLAGPQNWTSSGTIPRRATINAFGFGGINAHVLIEEYLTPASPDIPYPTAPAPLTIETSLDIAIIGIAIDVGNAGSPLDSLSGKADENPEFVPLRSRSNDWGVEQSDWYQTEFGTNNDSDSAKNRGISEVRLPLGEFRIPPLEMQDMLPQQQLMLRAAAAALRNSVRRIQPSSNPQSLSVDSTLVASGANEELGNRTGVFVGIELDPNTTNFHLRWSVEEQAPIWADEIGLQLSPSEMKEWIEQLKDAVGPGLTANRVMGNLGGIVASRLAREFNAGGPSFTISSAENSGLRACELAANAIRRRELDRAIVGAVDLPCDIRSQVAAQRESAKRNSAPVTDGATAIVLKRLEDAIRDGDKIHAVIRKITETCDPSIPTASCGQSIGAATGLISLTRLVVSLAETTREEPYRHHWLRNRRDGDRRIRVLGNGVDGRNFIVELSEPPSVDGLKTRNEPGSDLSRHAISRRRSSVTLPAELFIIDGDSDEEISMALGLLSEQLVSATTVHELAIRWFRKRSPNPARRFAMTLVPKSVQELSELIQRAQSLFHENDPSQGRDRRIQFSHNPLGRSGKMAFVFPGSGNAFLGMGRELLAAFSDVLRRQDTENERLRDQYRPELIWNATSTAALLEDHKAMIFGQVALGTAICDLLTLFNVRPTASLGYSLGESAAFFGLRAWTDRDEMLQRMDDATLFGSDLVRPFNAARKAWNIPEGVAVDWISGVIDKAATEVQAAISQLPNDPVNIRPDQTNERQQNPRVYLLIINTPNQCVIGGQRDEVAKLVRGLAATFAPFSAPSTVHCEILRQVEPAYRALHLMKATPPTSPNRIEFYSTAWGRSYDLNKETAAEAIVAQAINTIDFPKVVERAYSDGVRLFVEIGPGSSCTRMIGEILHDRDHFAQSTTPATANPIGAFLELLGQLIAERIPVDLSYLYGDSINDDSIEVRNASNREVITLTGGTPFEIPIPPQGWQLASRPMVSEKICESPIQQPTATDTNGLDLMTQLDDMLEARLKAHETYLRVSAETQRIIAEQLEMLVNSQNRHDGEQSQSRTLSEQSRSQMGLSKINTASLTVRAESEQAFATQTAPVRKVSLTTEPLTQAIPTAPPRSLSRAQCMEFAIGKIGRVLGSKFAEIDQHPTRVRLPDEPLMLVDRILEIEGEPLSMTSGRVVTEHDIHPGAWYLDCNRIPTCIAVEAGQADLFLSGWLGIDFETKGKACYRLLDAVVTFHRELPQPGKTIHYNIRIINFFRQGATYLFRFEFDATVDGNPLLTMREGCAGFFTEAELAAGKGIVHTALDRQPRPGKRTDDWTELVPMSVESYDDSQLLALRQGRIEACFGKHFAKLPVTNPITIPGIGNAYGSLDASSLQGTESAAPQRANDTAILNPSPDAHQKTWLVDRVLKVDPVGGKFGLGTILGELDIHPDDWFLTCHFCDDQVMPGTLMYECCLHTLRIFLLRMGWIGEAGTIVYEPIPGVRSRLKCRGQVRANTKKVWYEITLKEVGYTQAGSAVAGQGVGSHDDATTAPGTPYCLADALMYADGKPIVEITDMSVRLSGLTRDAVEALWKRRKAATLPVNAVQYDRRPALFDTDRITAFAIGNPSDAFGDRYRVFDTERIIARLPGPPFQFLDRIVAISGCQPWVLQAGGEVVAQYDVPPDAWYFEANRQKRMPFAVLLETALQPCGWLAAYVGSALTSDIDLSFRNLGGTATQYVDVTPESGTLTTTVKMTRVSNSGGMIIQHYDFDLRCNGQPVYVGNTYFGFFSRASLANQVGIRDAKPFVPSVSESASAKRYPYQDAPPFADSRFRMIDNVQVALDHGPSGNGFVIGTTMVEPASWFFKAHFHQDPVVPGSLGLESFFQLLKFYAVERWKLGHNAEFSTPMIQGQSPAISAKHEWVYRGQVIPHDKLVTVSAVISQVDDARRELTAEGFLSIDGRIIYQMKNFSLGISV